MPCFAVNRKDMNIGCGDGSGKWLFEEFMLSDSVFGRALVQYTPELQVERDNGRVISSHFEISDPVVTEMVVFDDDGEDIPLNENQQAEMRAMVLGAFSAQLDRVREYEFDVLNGRWADDQQDKADAMDRRMKND